MRIGSFLLVLCLGFSFSVLAQKRERVEILGARNFEYLKGQDRNISKLIGDVKLKQQQTFLFCDSALIDEEANSVEAFSNVRIQHNDTVTITGDYLQYAGDTKKALITGHVVLSDPTMTLNTDQLDYDLNNQLGYYDRGGTLISKENKLTSQVGYYFARKNEFFFKRNVVLTNPDYSIQSDTLLYNTFTKTAYFHGATKIVGKSDRILCENGWHNTEKDQSQFSRNAVVFTDRKMLKADSLFYDRKNQLGKAFRNLHIYDSVQRIHLFGNFGVSNGKSGNTYVHTNSFAMKLMDTGDTLYLFGDTLWLTEVRQKPKQKETMRVFHQVRMFRADMQAVCDSLVYEKADSAIRMYRNPVLWSGVSQFFSDTIVFFVNNSRVDSFYLLNDAMVISKERGDHYNQVSGKWMKGRLDSNQIREMKVFGNAQSITYAKEDSVHYSGVNVVDCSKMEFRFRKGEMDELVSSGDVDAVLYPPNEKKPEELRLRRFKWYGSRRPQRPAVKMNL